MTLDGTRTYLVGRRRVAEGAAALAERLRAPVRMQAAGTLAGAGAASHPRPGDLA